MADGTSPADARSLIYGKMALVLRDVEAIAKERKNPQQGYQFRGVDDVMTALHPVLAKHGVFCVPLVEEMQREQYQTRNGAQMTSTVLKVRHRFYAEDGSSVDAIVIGEGSDSADKSANKAMSTAFKYAMFETFCIPTEDQADSDPDRDTPEGRGVAGAAGSQRPGKQRGGQQQQTPQPAGQPAQPSGDVQQPGRKSDRAGNGTAAPLISDSQRQRLFTLLRNTGHTAEDFKVWLKQHHNLESSKDITRAIYDGICKRVQDKSPLLQKAA